MTWWRQIITGADNETVAIGRVMGLIVFALFIIGLPVAAVVTLAKGLVAGDEWGKIMASLQVYVPAILLSVGGLIGLTAKTDPKGNGDA